MASSLRNLELKKMYHLHLSSTGSTEAEQNLTLRTPFRILPPATPPFKSSTSHPGLFTSKDLITEKENTFMYQWDKFTKQKLNKKNQHQHLKCEVGRSEELPMSRGSDVKSLMGTGIFLTMYSQTTSMLYLSCADIGMMGAPSATVPAEDKTKKTLRERWPGWAERTVVW